MPGGCYVEGVSLNDAYFWKPSVGPIQDRPGHYNGPWHYWSTDGRCACMNMLRESPLTATKISPSSATSAALLCIGKKTKDHTFWRHFNKKPSKHTGLPRVCFVLHPTVCQD